MDCIKRAMILLFLLLLVNCQPQEDPAPTATGERMQLTATPSRPSEQEAPTSTAAATAQTAIPSPTSTPVSDTPLSHDGPWWVFRAAEGLWAVNPDGSGLTLILERTGPDQDAWAFRYEPSPGGGQLALIEIENRHSQTPPLLRLVSFPDGQITPIASLHPDVTDQSADTDSYDRWVATGVLNALSWSPDGAQLAFNAVIDGDSGDLYVYSISNGQLTRLTSGPTESVFPVWSPDGRRIVHGAVLRLNIQMSGAGYDYANVWSAEADGTAVELLFETEIIGFENILGWQSDSVLLVDTETPNDNPFCSYSDLRSFDLDTRGTKALIGGRYAARSFDPESKTVLFSVGDEPNCEGELRPGLYVMDSSSGRPPIRFTEDKAWQVEWSAQAELFFAHTEFGVIAADTSGQFIDLVVPEETFGLPIVAPGSRRLAWTGNELWIGSLQDNLDNPPRKVLTGRIWEASWSPDGRRLLFITGDGLFIASEPDFVPLEVADFRGFSPIWVMPVAE